MAHTAAIYCRVNTHAEDSGSVDRQQARCEAYAQRMGWTVGAVYSDHGSAMADARPGWERLIEDRLYRRHSDGMVLADALRRHDGTVHVAG